MSTIQGIILQEFGPEVLHMITTIYELTDDEIIEMLEQYEHSEILNKYVVKNE